MFSGTNHVPTGSHHVPTATWCWSHYVCCWSHHVPIDTWCWSISTTCPRLSITTCPVGQEVVQRELVTMLCVLGVIRGGGLRRANNDPDRSRPLLGPQASPGGGAIPLRSDLTACTTPCCERVPGSGPP